MKSFKGVDGWTDDDGQQVITIAHPEPCSGELKTAIEKSVSKVLYLSINGTRSCNDQSSAMKASFCNNAAT